MRSKGSGNSYMGRVWIYNIRISFGGGRNEQLGRIWQCDVVNSSTGVNSCIVSSLDIGLWEGMKPGSGVAVDTSWSFVAWYSGIPQRIWMHTYTKRKWMPKSSYSNWASRHQHQNVRITVLLQNLSHPQFRPGRSGYKDILAWRSNNIGIPTIHHRWSYSWRHRWHGGYDWQRRSAAL